MNPRYALPVASLLTLLLLVSHLAGDIIHGYERGATGAFVGVVTAPVVWLCGTLLWGDRRSGHVIMLLGGLLAMYVAYLHMSGAGVGVSPKVAGDFSFVLILLALAVTGAFSVVLSVRGLWSLRRATGAQP